MSQMAGKYIREYHPQFDFWLAEKEIQFIHNFRDIALYVDFNPFIQSIEHLL